MSGHGMTPALFTEIDMSSAVNHPAHYGGADNPYEAIKVIEAWGLGFCLGNAAKYIARAGKKGDAIEDLEKARWYLDREIQSRKAAAEAGPWVHSVFGTQVLTGDSWDTVCALRGHHELGMAPAAWEDGRTAESDEANAAFIAAARSDIPEEENTGWRDADR